MTSYLLIASGVGTRSPTWTTAVECKGAVICTPAYPRYPFTAGWTGGGGGRQGKKNGQCSSASGGTRTHDPWIMSPRPKPLHHQPPPPYIQHTYILTHTRYINTHLNRYSLISLYLPRSGKWVRESFFTPLLTPRGTTRTALQTTCC